MKKIRTKPIAKAPRRRSAFTLIELLLVLVILVILAGLVFVNVHGRPEQARDTVAKVKVDALGSLVNQFYLDTGRMPTTEEGLDVLVNEPSGITGTWRGPYTSKEKLLDPWGTPFMYRYPGTIHANEFDIVSFGPDKHEGNDDIAN